MRRYDMKYLFSALTALLLLLWARSGSGASMPETILIRVPPGWMTASEGYYLNESALSSLTMAAQTYRLEKDAWERAYLELSEQGAEFEDRLRRQLSALRESLENERRTWRGEIRRARGPGFGIFAGGGYTASGSFEPVIGVGLVWRVR